MTCVIRHGSRDNARQILETGAGEYLIRNTMPTTIRVHTFLCHSIHVGAALTTCAVIFSESNNVIRI